MLWQSKGYYTTDKNCYSRLVGRLIRIRKFAGDPSAVAYIVALTDPDAALLLIKTRVAAITDEVEDLGRVSEALLAALELNAGEFTRVDKSSLGDSDLAKDTNPISKGLSGE